MTGGPREPIGGPALRSRTSPPWVTWSHSRVPPGWEGAGEGVQGQPMAGGGGAPGGTRGLARAGCSGEGLGGPGRTALF